MPSGVDILRRANEEAQDVDAVEIFRRSAEPHPDLPPLDIPAQDADFLRGLRYTQRQLQAGDFHTEADKAEDVGDLEQAVRLRNEARYLEQEAEAFRPRTPDVTQLEGAGDYVDFGQQAIGSVLATAIPSMISGAPGAAAGAAVGGAVAGPPGAAVGGFLGGFCADAA
jgi:hypothetical protein